MAIATQLSQTALNGIGSLVVPSAPGQSSFPFIRHFTKEKTTLCTAPPGQTFQIAILLKKIVKNFFKREPKGEDEED
jgi:hypothetical protein